MSCRRGERHEHMPVRSGYNGTLNRPWHCRCGAVHKRDEVICPRRHPDEAYRNSHPQGIAA